MALAPVIVDEPSAERTALEMKKLRLELKAAKLKLKKDRVDLAEKIREANSALVTEAFEFAKDDEAHGVYAFVGIVNRDTVRAARAAINAWIRLDPDPAEGEERVIDIKSPGGSCLDGLDLFGVIRAASSHGFKIKTIISGFAGSMAGLLVQAGDERLIRRHSYLHLHEAASIAWGKGSDLKDEAAFVDRLSRQCAEIYAERSTLSADEIYDRMERKEWILSAEEALDVGFVDGIL